MTNDSPPTPRHIVLVGVAGVGKTTLGAMAAQRFGLPFIDIDAEFEKASASDIDTLQRQLGEAGYDRQLLSFFAEQLRAGSRTIFAAPPRLTHLPGFWSALADANATAICLCGEPMEIYLRQEMFEGDRRLTTQEKLTPQRKAQFLDYYQWRQGHCLRAEVKVQIVGNREMDTTLLCGRIRSLLK
jgi:shikimate kinase